MNRRIDHSITLLGVRKDIMGQQDRYIARLQAAIQFHEKIIKETDKRNTELRIENKQRGITIMKLNAALRRWQKRYKRLKEENKGK